MFLIWRWPLPTRLVLAAAAVIAVLSGIPASAEAPSIGSSNGIALFAPDWKPITNRTDQQWTDAGRNFAVVMGTKELYGEHLAKIRAGNPSVTILMYNLGPYLLRASPIYTELMTTHPDYFARDKSGKLVTVKQQAQMTLMDQGNPGWRALHAVRVRDFLDRYPVFDGVQVDCMGFGAVRGYTTAKPIDPTTKAAYTTKRWLELSVLTLNEIKAAVAPRLVMFNGLGGGTQYGVTKILATSNADGGMAEGFLREALADVSRYPTVAAWTSNLNMLTDMTARGKSFFAWTKTWGPNAADQNRAEWNTFALATYLLGKGANTYYNFIPTLGLDRTRVAYPNMQANLGAALGPYSVSSGVYTRRFQGGVVTVNPAAHTASITLTPAATTTSVSTTTTSTSSTTTTSTTTTAPPTTTSEPPTTTTEPTTTTTEAPP